MTTINSANLTTPTIYDFQVNNIDGNPVSLSNYRDKVLLIVNVASKCGFTQQYKGLQELYEQHGPKGLMILGFPCNQFGKQEPGSESEIKQFCELNYHVTFPLFQKIEVNGKNAHPLFQYLKEQAKGALGTLSVKWNFTKFLVNKKGEVIRRFAPIDTPKSLTSGIEALL